MLCFRVVTLGIYNIKVELAGKLAEDNHLVYGDNLIEVMNFMATSRKVA